MYTGLGSNSVRQQLKWRLQEKSHTKDAILANGTWAEVLEKQEG